MNQLAIAAAYMGNPMNDRRCKTGQHAPCLSYNALSTVHAYSHNLTVMKHLI